ncbi:MAG TPA: hypothetical protein VF369_03600 [candidate division Zixibacteria bacterium]
MNSFDYHSQVDKAGILRFFMITIFGKENIRSIRKIGFVGIKPFIFIFLFLTWISGCSRPIQPKSDSITLELGEVTYIRYFDVMDKVTFEGDEAIRLSDLVDSAVTDYPSIYAYRIIGSDGFYAAKKGSPDNLWEHMQNGYLKLDTRRVAFEPSLGLEGRYYVKDVVSIELLRKIDTRFGSEETFRFFLVQEMNATTYPDSTDALFGGRTGIKLSDFIDTSLTYTPEDYSFTLNSVEGEKKTLSWAEIQTGWWLFGLDITKFYPDLGADSRISRLEAIELTPVFK